jgi:2-C-methyl-D-erythritol 4-phosphate cytidylyltransferase
MAEGITTRPFLAIVTAAGKAERMGLKNGKALVQLAGKPCLSFSLGILERVAEIDEIVIVCPEGQEDRIRQEVIIPFGFSKVRRILPGGATRQESVRIGLVYAKTRKPEYVLVHDAARPLIDKETTVQCIVACEKHGGSIVAIPVSDTLKRGDEFVAKTLRRKKTWNAQTPQAFSFRMLWKGHEQARKDGFAGTDDASLVERIGGTVAIVPGSKKNIKITYPEDLEIAEALLKAVEG